MQPRTLRLTDALALPALSVVIVGVVYPWASQFPYGWLDDDAYFYAKIAYNLGVHGSSSFDGLHVTDGYHLLWAGLLGAVSWAVSLVTRSKEVHLFFFLVASMTVILYVPWRFGRGPAEKLTLLGLGILGKLLMGTHLLAAVFLELVAVGHRAAASGRRARLACWLLAALVPMIRIDALPLVLVLAAAYLRRRPGTAHLLLGGALCGAALQMLLNRAIAGSWYSVAARLRAAAAQAWSPAIPLENLLGGGLGYTLRAALLIGLGTLGGFLLTRLRATEERRSLKAAWLGVALFSFGHLLLTVIRSWYYTAGHLVFAWLVFRAAPDGRNRFGWATRLVAVVTAIGVLGFLGARGTQAWGARERARGVREFVAAIDARVPPGEAVYQVDASGYVGFFSRRPIVNGDGLVNTHAYADRLMADRLAGYLTEEGICYFITNRAPRGTTLLDYHGLRVERQEAVLVLERRADGSRHPTSDFRLYRRRDAACEVRSAGSGS